LLIDVSHFILFITSVKGSRVANLISALRMFSSALFLFICLLAGLRKHYPTGIQKNWRKGGMK